jgi:two-component system OmpR family sensor kinase
MLAFNKSLKRFLIVYIVSSLFLIAIGTILYYLMSYHAIIDININNMKKDLEHFITINKKTNFIKNNTTPQYDKLKLVIFINNKKIVGNFDIEADFDLTPSYVIIKHKLYYIHKEHRMWGNIHAITYTDIYQDVQQLQQQVLLFFLLCAVFVVLISFVLGRIFLKPMKNSIDALQNFIADSTHEINTPLSNIIVNIELLKELYPKLASVEEFEKIQTSTFRISQIFKDLTFVQFNHTQAKKIRPISVKNIVSKRFEFFQTLIKNKKLHISFDMQDMQLTIDSEDLTRLIDNLISNAIKYTAIDGHIEVALQKNFLQIQNDGQLNTNVDLTDKYTRANKHEGGFGLGLFIVKKICDMYGMSFHILHQNNKVSATVYFC